jgi:hypothetical protein
MKPHPIFSAVIFCILILSFRPTIAQNIAINSTGSAADASAMLDVQSSNKGLLIPQVSLTGLTAASPLTSPAHSLLVYNTNASITGGKGYYYNSGDGTSPVWTKLASSDTDWKLAGNAGNDSATHFIGTTDGKPLVLKTNNTSRINVSSDGITKIGASTDYTKFENDGTIVMEGAATVWDDLRVALDNGSNAATLDYISGGSGPQIWFFRNNGTVEAMSFTAQLPHSWKEGTTIYPHLHWIPKSAGTGDVEWNFEYSWINYNSGAPETFPSVTTSTVTATVPINSTNKHLITALTASNAGISGTGKKVSSVLICRIWRNSNNPNDLYGADAGLISLDFHLELDTFGSRLEYSK